MRAPLPSRLFTLGLLVAPLGLALALGGCGESFDATGGGGAGAGEGGGAPAGSGGSGGQGTTTVTGEGGGAPLCEPPGNDACATCLAGTCEEPYCGCANSESCVKLVNCLLDGGENPTPDWTELCFTYHPSGIAALGRLHACGSEHCAACGYEAVSECAACQYEHCDEEVNACLGSAACHAFIECALDCSGESACLAGCNSTEAPGMALYQPLADCTKAKCGAACKPGP